MLSLISQFLIPVLPFLGGYLHVANPGFLGFLQCDVGVPNFGEIAMQQSSPDTSPPLSADKHAKQDADTVAKDGFGDPTARAKILQAP